MIIKSVAIERKVDGNTIAVAAVVLEDGREVPCSICKPLMRGGPIVIRVSSRKAGAMLDDMQITEVTSAVRNQYLLESAFGGA